MDPVTASAGDAALRATVMQAMGAGRRAIRAARLMGTVDPCWLSLVSPGGERIELTGPQTVSLASFLESDRVRPVMALLVTSLLAGDSDEALDPIRGLLHGEAKRWNIERRPSWLGAFDALWTSILDTFDARLPRPSDVAGYSEELDEMSAFIQTPLHSSSNSGSSRRFVEKLVQLGSDLSRLLAVEQLAVGVADGIREGKQPPIIGHTDAGASAGFESLYVSRTLHSGHDGAERSTVEVTAAGRGYRAVILGNPGAGKSTLVSHVMADLASDSGGRQGTVLVRCREYLARGWNGSLLDFAWTSLRADYGLAQLATVLDDALTLGKLTVVFDGLDEVTDPYQRSEMVQRIHRFAATYPVASILVTSRELGYARAPLDATVFSHYQLRDFSEDQIHEYAGRWFAVRETPELVPAFMAESESVRDLRRNPLLLSLLCILYGARGALPRRRREIYSKCADLLFHTWDSRRRIAQPDDLPSYGYRLMQEIARWIYQSTAAQEGVEQQQMEKVVAIHLGDLGVNPGEADRRAREFLDFCAERAWLLGAFGTNDYGQRIFRFTHKTFFEFFAAEALSRQASAIEDIATEIIKAFGRDSTSVVAELILQAYDERVADGAKSAFAAVCERHADPALILRLMNGALLPERTRLMGFDKVLASHRLSDLSAYDALVALDPNAFATFESLIEDGDERATEFFAKGWAIRRLTGSGYFGTPSIALAADAVADRLVLNSKAIRSDPVMSNWLVLEGKLDPSRVELQKLLVVPIGDEFWAGSVWVAITEILGTTPRDHALRLVEHLVSTIADTQVASPIGRLLAENLKARGGVEAAYLSSTIDVASDLGRLGYAGVAIVAMLADEAGVEIEWLQARVAGTGDSTRDLIAIRRWRAGTAERPSRSVAERAQRQLTTLPPWVKQWCDGNRSLLQPS